MAVAQHPVIAKGTHASLLPPSWTTLYALTRLPEETLEAKIAEGVIHADRAQGCRGFPPRALENRQLERHKFVSTPPSHPAQQTFQFQ
jgi:hypothetical protein